MVDLNIDKSNWQLISFGDVTIQKKGRVDRESTTLTRYVKGEHMGSEDIHLREWGELDDEYLGPAFHRRFDEGDILYGSRRTYLKKVCIAPFDGITSNTTFVVEANEEFLDKRLLPFIMLSEGFTKHSIQHSKGSVNPYINWKDLANYEFLLPPKHQQAEIAELLWALDEVRELRLSLRRSIKVMMDVEFAEFTSRGEGEIVEFSSLFELTKEKSKSPHSLNRYVGLEHIEPGAFSISSWGNSSSVKGDATILLAGDVGYSKLRPYLDKAFIADFDCVASTEVLKLRPIGVASRTLLQILHSSQFLKFISDKGYGTKMPRVNEKIIGSYRLRLPADEDALLVRVDSYQNLLSEISMSLRSSHDLSLGLINKVFNHV